MPETEAAQAASKQAKETGMKIIQAAVLVLVGALGAMLYLKVKTGPEAQIPATQAPVQQASQPAALDHPAAPVPEPAEPAPVRTAKRNSSRTPAPRQQSEPVSKPINSQPVLIAENHPAPPVSSLPAPNPAPPPAPVVEVTPAPVEPPPPPAREVTIQAGTLLPVRLIETISSDRNHPGDTFTASLDAPLVVDGFVIAEKGSRAEGRIVESQQAGRVKGLASVALELTKLSTSDGQRVQISTGSFTKMGPESKNADAAKIGGGAALGAIIGAIAGGGKGAAIGAGVGGAAGTGAVVGTRGKAAELPSETKISFRLNNAVTITEKRR
jgi:hypothetical protein